MNNSVNTPNQSNPKNALGIAILFLVVALALTIVFISNAPYLVTWGMVGFVWYLILLFVAACCAISLFYLFDCYADYSGKVMGGTLKMGGPIVFLMVIVFTGIKYAPQATTDFDFTIFLEDQQGNSPVLNQGTITLTLGADKRTEQVGSKGEVRFINIPAGFRNQPAKVSVQNIHPWALQTPALQTTVAEVTLAGESHTLVIQVKTDIIQGEVLDEELKPVAGAQVRVLEHSVSADENGVFSLSLPASLSTSQRELVISARGYQPRRLRFEFNSGGIQVVLPLQQ